MVDVRAHNRSFNFNDRPEYYIMSARSIRNEVLNDKSWLAGNTFLIVRTPSGKRFVISGSGHGYDEIGTSHSYIFDTGNGHKKPSYDDRYFVIEDKILFDDRGEPNKPFSIGTSGFYVMK